MSAPKFTPGPWEVDGHMVRTADGEFNYIADTYNDDTDFDHEDSAANARLIAAAPDLLEAQTMGVQLNTPDFLDWIAARLVAVHNESPFVDYVVSLRERAKAGRAAIAKAEGREG